MPRSHKTIIFLVGLLTGIWASPLLDKTALLVGVSVAILVLVLVIIFKKQYVVMIPLFIIGTSLGIWRYDMAIVPPGPGNIASYNNKGSITFHGTIVDEPNVQGTSAKLTVEVSAITTGTEWKKTAGLVLVSTGKYPEFSYGDRVEVTGSVEAPEDFQGFQYTTYLARYGIYSVMKSVQIKKVAPGSVSSVESALVFFRKRVEGVINDSLPEPHASFLAGLLVGSRRNIPQSTLDSFQTTGITHIIAISGYNITLIVVLLGALLKRRRRGVQVTVTIVFIVLFTILVGASAAVVRASIMGVVGLIALYFNRTTAITIQVLLAASIMCFWNPFILRNDIGFQLSFSAVLGLVYVSPWLAVLLKKIPNRFGIQESLALTLSAQIMSTPLILLNFHRVSLIAPLTNLLVAPAIPFSMLAGGILLVTSSVPIVGVVVQSATWLLLSYTLTVADRLSHVPLASVANIEWGSGATILWYIAVTIISYCHARWKTYRV